MSQMLYTEDMAKSDRLLQAVLERPEDVAAVRVYGDALQARGDPRGALMAVQLQRELLPEPRKRRLLKLQEQELISGHRAELLGPLARLRKVSVAWRQGFARELHVEVVRDEISELCEALRQPAFALLQRLSVRLTNVHDASGLVAALPRYLHHFALTPVMCRFDCNDVVASLPPLRSLEVHADDLDLDGIELPALERLRSRGAVENLTAPKIGVLVAGDGDRAQVAEELPASLRLLRLLGEAELDAVRRPEGAQGVVEWGADQHVKLIITGADQPLDLEGRPGWVVREGWGVADERAFVLTGATPDQVDAAFDELERGLGGQYRLAVAEVVLGALKVSAIELRLPEPRAELLGLLATAVAKRAWTMEVAASSACGDALLRAYSGDEVKPLAMGPFRDREEVWRTGVDLALGFDPGRIFDEVLEALDAELPRRASGDASAEPRGEWPCATPLAPSDRARPAADFYEEDEGDALEGEDDHDGWSEVLSVQVETPDETASFAEAAAPITDTSPVEVTTAEIADDDEELEFVSASGVDGSDPEWAEIMTDTPIDLEDDGSERNPEEGLETNEVDPEVVRALAGPPCARCDGSNLDVETCARCGRDVCSRCAFMEGDQVRCRACA